ncbi:MAG TPA: class I SAM-dependent methyltransferase [Terriglobia bacterium]|nr:class I SAM-dependent methyltransferase [Terriglobia bacterium]
MLEIYIDEPHTQSVSSISGWLEVSGWAAGTEPVEKVTLRVAEGEAVRARYGGFRLDVGAARPKYVNGSYSGFSGHIRIPPLTRGVSLEASAFSLGGVRASATKVIDVDAGTDLELLPDPSLCPGCARSGNGLQTRFQRGPYGLHKCGNCGLGFVSPMPSPAILKAYYDNEYWRAAAQLPQGDHEHHDTAFIADLLRIYHPAPRRVLEIGCGPGTLLAGLKRRGFEVMGQDYSSEAARLAEKIFGIQVRVAAIRDLPNWSCDAIVLRHVIEHSPTAWQDLLDAAAMLGPKGLLLVVTPNLDSLVAEFIGASWEWFVPPAHLFYFSPRSLSAFAAQAGLAICQMTTRRGDGAPYAPTLSAWSDYEGSRISEWESRRLQQAIALLGQSPNSELLIGALGLGSEVVAVLSRP